MPRTGTNSQHVIPLLLACFCTSPVFNAVFVAKVWIFDMKLHIESISGRKQQLNTYTPGHRHIEQLDMPMIRAKTSREIRRNTFAVIHPFW